MKLYKDKYEIKVTDDYLNNKHSYSLALSYDYLKTLNSNKEFQEYLSSTFKTVPVSAKFIDFDNFKTEMTKLDVRKLNDMIENSYYNNTKELCGFTEDEKQKIFRDRYYYDENKNEISKKQYYSIVENIKNYHYYGHDSTELELCNEFFKKHNNISQIREPALFDSLEKRFIDKINPENKNYKSIFNVYYNPSSELSEFIMYCVQVYCENDNNKTVYKIKVISFTLDEDNYYSIPHEEKTLYTFSSFSELEEKLKETLGDEEKLETFFRETFPKEVLESNNFDATNIDDFDKNISEVDEEYDSDFDDDAE